MYVCMSVCMYVSKNLITVGLDLPHTISVAVFLKYLSKAINNIVLFPSHLE